MEIKLSDLQPNTGQIEGVPENPRYITEEKFAWLKKSLQNDPDFLKYEPLQIYDNHGQYVVVGGNMRLKAMLELGWTTFEHTTDIMAADTPADVIAARVIKANSGYGEYDDDMIANEWDDYPLEEWGYDAPDWGEDDSEVPEGADETPEPPGTPISKLGDIWLLGDHRVLCGDSTDRATVERLMDGKKADMVFTDPPYGMNLDTDYSKMPSTKAQGNKTHKAVIGDDEPFNYGLFEWIDIKEQVWFGANYYAKTLPDQGSWLVWDKRVEEKFDKMFGSGFEIAWSKTPHKQKIYRHNNTLFGGDSEARGKEHPTQKPTKLCIEMIDDIGKAAKTILDLFLGSGSTLIACEQTNRKCYGLELDPAYVDTICKRWQTLTGQLPILESTGEPHDFQ